MWAPIDLLCVILFGFFCWKQVLQVTAIDILKPKELHNVMPIKAIPSLKPSLESLNWIQQKSRLKAQSKIPRISTKRIERRDIPFQQPFLGLTSKNENEEKHGVEHSPQQQYVLPRFQAPKPLVKPNETEAERAERIHKSFERLLTFVEIVGQVDNYVSSKWKNLVKTVSNFYEVEDEPYRVNAKRIYGTCSNPH